MAHIPYLQSIYPLAGVSAVDIGAGEGTFSRQLAAEGAKVTAIEIDADKVAWARAHLPADITVKRGVAEKLPLPDASQDLCCMFFSLHHVPKEAQDTAFAEILRVTKPAGRLHIVEPFAYGTMFDVVRFVEDETEVRTHSHAILPQLPTRLPLRLVAHEDYTLTRAFDSFDDFAEQIIRIDPARMEVFPDVADEMRAAYENAVEEEAGGRVLRQPCAAYHFEVLGAAKPLISIDFMSV